MSNHSDHAVQKSMFPAARELQSWVRIIFLELMYTSRRRLCRICVVLFMQRSIDWPVTELQSITQLLRMLLRIQNKRALAVFVLKETKILTDIWVATTVNRTHRQAERKREIRKKGWIDIWVIEWMDGGKKGGTDGATDRQTDR